MTKITISQYDQTSTVTKEKDDCNLDEMAELFELALKGIGYELREVEIIRLGQLESEE